MRVRLSELGGRAWAAIVPPIGAAIFCPLAANFGERAPAARSEERLDGQNPPKVEREMPCGLGAGDGVGRDRALRAEQRFECE